LGDIYTNIPPIATPLKRRGRGGKEEEERGGRREGEGREGM